jgi:hypothetical protein
MTNENLTSAEAKSLVDRLGPSLGCGDFTYDPVFPKTRKDVCAVRRMVENGSDYGYDTIYLIWKNNDGMNHEELMNSSSSKDYVHVGEVIETEEDIVVKVSSDGSYSGHAWKDEIEKSKKELGLK